MSVDPFGDFLKKPYDGSGVNRDDVFANIGSGGPLLDQTASDSWRSQPTPLFGESNFLKPAPAPAPPPDPGFFGNIKNAIGNAAGGIGAAVKKIGTSDFLAPSPDAAPAGEARNLIGSTVAPFWNDIVGKGADLRSFLGGPKSDYFNSPQASQNATNMFSTIGGGALPYGVPEAAVAERGSIGAADLQPTGSLALGPGKVPETGSIAMPADLSAREPAALPSGAYANQPGLRIGTPDAIDITQGLREAPPITAENLRPAEQPYPAVESPLEGEFHELPSQAPATLTPGRPYSFADLESRAGVKPGQPLFAPNETPMGIDAKVRSGLDLTKLPDRALSDTADAAAGRVPTTDVSTTPDLRAQLEASLKAKGRPDLIVGDDLKPVATPPSSFVAANPAKLAIHDANEAVIQALRTYGPGPQVEEAMQTVKSLGGDLNHTADRIRAAGLPGPTPSGIKAAKSGRITAQDLATRIKGDTGGQVPPSAAAVPPVRGGLRDRLATFGKDQGGEGRLDLGLTGNRAAPRLAYTDENGVVHGWDTRDQGPAAQWDAQYKTAIDNGLSPEAATKFADSFGPRGSKPDGGASRFFREETGSGRLDLGLTGPDRPARADGTGTETIAQAKQRLADQAGVDPTTGKPLAGVNVPTAGALPKTGRGPITMADLARKAENVTGVGKTLTTAASPFHFMFRHALPAMVSHPQAWLKGSVKGLGEGFTMTPKELAARQDAMRSNLKANGYGNVYIARPHSGIVGGEESVASNVVNRIPILGKVIERSGQGFVQGLNEVRYEMTKGINDFAVAMAKKGLAEPMTVADRARMGDTINTYTGRGIDTANMGEAGKTAMRAANVSMFSPQMVASRVKMLAYTARGLADVAHNIAARRPVDPVALEQARLGIGAMVGMGGLTAIMQAAGGKTDTGGTSTTFGQTDIGAPSVANGAAAVLAAETGIGSSAYPGKDVMLNPTESEANLIRTIARLAVSIHNEATTGKGTSFGAAPESPMDVATKYAISQLFSSPVTYPIAEFLQGFAVSPLDSVLPMPITAGLNAAGIQLPTLGGKPAPTPKPSPTPKTTMQGTGTRTAKPAPTR